MPSLRTFLAVIAASELSLYYSEAVSARAATTAGTLLAYRSYRRKFRGNPAEQVGDELVFTRRLRIFTDRRAQIEAHNAQPTASWKAVVNKFTDFSDEERRALLGYKRVGGRWSSPVSRGVSLLEFGTSVHHSQSMRDIKDLYARKDWREGLNSSSFFREQGSCGSCWAVAAVGAVEMHKEILDGEATPLSFNHLVDCVENPQQCGGTGGCSGATATLAFEYIQKYGVANDEDYTSANVGETCMTPKQVGLSIGGFVQLPVNKYQPMLHAITNDGPIVSSVDASSWFSYGSGIFDDCPMDATVNHAVLLVGYGYDADLEKMYWTVRNSWGSSWGEDSHMRIKRHDSDEGSAGYCGTDYDPQQGTACLGGPKEIPVCGMCGILSDNSYPKGVMKL